MSSRVIRKLVLTCSGCWLLRILEDWDWKGDGNIFGVQEIDFLVSMNT